ncbi:MAG: SPW repeat protein [Haloarculaceae archaeon]
MNQTVRLVSGVNTLLGGWFVVAPFVFGGTAAVGAGFLFWNHVVVGLGILALAASNTWLDYDGDPGRSWAAAGNVVLGLWMAMVPVLAVALVPTWLFRSDVVLGLTVAALSGYNAYRLWAATDDTAVALAT